MNKNDEDYNDLELPVAGNGGMLQRLDNRGVRVMKISVFSDNGNLDAIVEPLRPEGQVPPPVQEGAVGVTLHQIKPFAEDLNDSLLLKEEGHVVKGFAVMHAENLS